MTSKHTTGAPAQRIGVLVNEFKTLVPSQATAMFIHTLALNAERVVVFGVADVGADEDGRVTATSRIAATTAASIEAQTAQLKAAVPEIVALAELDLILIRTNPARDPRTWAHEGALQLMAQLRDEGVRVSNDPDGLRNAGSKLFLAQLPPWTRARTLISADRKALAEFVRTNTHDGNPAPSVLKPARGTRGSDVYKLAPDDANLNVILDGLLRQGFVIAQDFVPAAVNGDTRVIVLDGRVLELDGRCAAVQRVPSGADFRSNVHVGGTARPGTVTPGMRRAVESIAPMLARQGIRLAGLDFLGDLVCEVNVFATGGFGDAELFFERRFAQHALDTLCLPPVEA